MQDICSGRSENPSCSKDVCPHARQLNLDTLEWEIVIFNMSEIVEGPYYVCAKCKGVFIDV